MVTARSGFSGLSWILSLALLSALPSPCAAGDCGTLHAGMEIDGDFLLCKGTYSIAGPIRLNQGATIDGNDSEIVGNGIDGFVVEAGEVTIKNLTLIDFPIRVANCSDVTVSNNLFLNEQGEEYYAKDGISIIDYANDIHVVGNTFHQVGTAIYRGKSSEEMSFSQSQAIFLENNIFHQVQHYAVFASMLPSDTLSIQGNSFYECGNCCDDSSGLHLGPEDFGEKTGGRFLLRYNLFHGSRWAVNIFGRTFWPPEEPSTPPRQDDDYLSEIRNNDFITNPTAIALDSGFVFVAENSFLDSYTNIYLQGSARDNIFSRNHSGSAYCACERKNS